MTNKGTIALVAVVVVAYYVYKQLACKDLFILLRGKQNLKSAVLKALPNTQFVYEIKSAAYDHLDYRNVTGTNSSESTDGNRDERWNYAVLARGFQDDIAVRNYLLALQHFDFVENTKEVTAIATKLNIVFNIYNMFLRAWGYVGRYLQIVPLRPFETSANSTRKCSKLGEEEGDIEIHSISLLSVVDPVEMNRYRSFFMWKAFPAYNVKLVYTGGPLSGTWSTFVIFRYEKYTDFCELIASRLYEEAVQHKYRSVGDSYGFIVTPI